MCYHSRLFWGYHNGQLPKLYGNALASDRTDFYIIPKERSYCNLEKSQTTNDYVLLLFTTIFGYLVAMTSISARNVVRKLDYRLIT